MTEPVIGYWFAAEHRLPHGDGRPVVIGETLSVQGKLKLCENALHGSRQPFDALRYAPGPLLFKCRYEGEIIEGRNKLGARSRTALAWFDATTLLRRFACDQALAVLPADAPQIVRDYLTTADENLRAAARDAAWAAWVAAWVAAWDAALAEFNRRVFARFEEME